MRLRSLGLLLDRKYTALRIELDHPITLGILDRVSEDRRPRRESAGLTQHALETLPVEDVVSQDQGHVVVPDEVSADEESLGQSARTRLDGISDREANLAPVLEHALEIPDVIGRRDQQDLANTGQHQGGEGIIDHRFIINGQQLLAGRTRDRIEP